MGVGSYIILAFVNWNEVYKIICKIDMSISTERSTQNDRKTTDILTEAQKKCKFTSLFFTILGILLLFFNLCDIFILHFVENVVGVEHQHQGNTNATNLYESLLLEKYPFSCWTPFDKNSVTGHLAIYTYTTIQVLMIALKHDPLHLSCPAH
jgi:hypothetical protein